MKYAKTSMSMLSSIAALLVSGCGGSAVNASIGGTVSGLPDTANIAVALVNNLADPVIIFSNGNFVFDIPIQSGSTYSVTVTTQPYGENCLIANGSGTVDQNGDAITNVVVTCTPNS